MGVRGGHATAAELMRYRDGEMGWMARVRLGRHLRRCAGCRERMEEQDARWAEVRAVYGVGVGEEAEGGRMRLLLQARMGEERGREGARGGLGWGRGVAVAAVLVVGLGAAGYAGWTRVEVPEAAAWPKPDVRLTPGAVRVVSLAEICPVGDGGEDQDPQVEAGVERRVFREYGMGDAPKQNYQVDYLISPQLGGTADLRNLWPQPYGAVWNARAKDRLETRLHEMVCRREMDLTAAQAAIATDWIAAYRTVFHTARPV